MTSRSSKVKYNLPHQAEKADYVRKNFGEIARRYDLFNDVITFGLHRLWKRRTVREVLPPTGGTILDLCCGSGDLTLAALRSPGGPGSTLHSVDFSPEMLDVLRSRLGSRGKDADRVTVELGDAMNLEQFQADRFDGAMIGFGLRNVTDRIACLRELARVLKPGGTVGILDVGHIKNPAVRFFHDLFFERIVPVIGYLIHGAKHEMYAYLPASARAFPNHEEMYAEFRAAGFAEPRHINFLFGSAVLYLAEK